MQLGLVELAAEAACVGERIGAASAEDVRLGGGEHLLGEMVGAAMVALGVSRLDTARTDVLYRRARWLEDGLAMPAEAQQSLALRRVGSPRSGSRGSSWHLDRPFLLRALHARERRWRACAAREEAKPGRAGVFLGFWDRNAPRKSFRGPCADARMPANMRVARCAERAVRQDSAYGWRARRVRPREFAHCLCPCIASRPEPEISVRSEKIHSLFD